MHWLPVDALDIYVIPTLVNTEAMNTLLYIVQTIYSLSFLRKGVTWLLNNIDFVDIIALDVHTCSSWHATCYWHLNSITDVALLLCSVKTQIHARSTVYLYEILTMCFIFL